MNIASATPHPETVRDAVAAALGDKAKRIDLQLGEVTVLVTPQNYLEVCRTLKEAPGCLFEQLIDLCGVDYSEYRAGEWDGARYAVVIHLLSLTHNHRVRVRVFAQDDDFPVVDSINGIWGAANWFEREAFDLYGIVFEGHSDLRRILTDYGFIGHPFRKDFPVSGHVEMRYDPERSRVIYQPVSIEPREITPRIIREENYAGIGMKIPKAT